jgi:hypothetical protein
VNGTGWDVVVLGYAVGAAAWLALVLRARRARRR